ncbi:MAG TPA: DUF4476 domain-containing protein [Parafilimonas sp.]|nr:DUF4476 domain-containing protein [Parafilimonas sp.]
MKHFASVLLLVFFSSIFFKVQAQQQHFIYIQSEDRQPFAVVLNGKVYSSSDYGYVIVPKLTDGDYNFTVSFPMNKYPDQNFKCVINKKDLGFKLENTTDKGWALENMQTQKVLANNSTASADNAFSSMLSDVVSDSNLTKKNLPVNNSKDDTTATSTNIDTTNVAAVTPDTNTVAAVTTIDTSNQTTTQSDKSTGIANDSVAQLQKISETKLDTGTNMVFVDKAAADTIKVFVPNDDTSMNNTSVNITSDSAINQPSVTEASNLPAAVPDNNLPKTDSTTTALNESSSQTTDTTTHAASNPFYKPSEQNTSTDVPANTNANVANANTSVENENLNKPKATNAVNELCIKMISDNDLDKIKRKMFVQSNDNAMVQTAVKYLGNKCLTTDQVKTLGNIFSSDDGRYSLYDALYKNVYDYGNYASLESQIIDPYYKRRFEAMLK